MNLVFYDTETTGTVLAFDQILQFAAILTDGEFQKIDQFEIRCRLLPWVVPAPMALKVTAVMPDTLVDPALPSHYEMMCQVRERLEAWSPAIFVGYNSMRFDEPLLQRALWQTLHPPYLTVTDGNARLDVLPLVQAASHLKDAALRFPRTAKGRTGFKLDQLAPLNGFSHENAHDALADVKATIHIARRLAERAPELWDTAVSRASKDDTASILEMGEPVLIVEHFPWGPSVWFGQRVDANASKGATATLARLDVNWSSLAEAEDKALLEALSRSPKPLRRIAMNKAPLVFSADEALTFWQLRTDKAQKVQSDFLRKEPSFGARLMDVSQAAVEPRPDAEYLEQMIFDGFPDREDAARIEAFHRASWPERVRLIRTFDDRRLCQLAQRLVYVSAPDLLEKQDIKKLESEIAARLHEDHGDDKLWRSLPAARRGLSELEGSAEATVIESWLNQLEARWDI